MSDKQNGSTLTMVLVALVVVSMFIVSQADNIAVGVENQQWRKTGHEGNQILDAVRNYYADASPSLSSRWPVDPIGAKTRLDTLIDGGYLTRQTSVYGTSWILAVASDDKTAILTLDPGDEDIARLIAGMLPGGQVVSKKVSTKINRPGDEAIHSLLYARDGNRELTGTLDADGQAIQNAASITYD